jgi:cell division topological specificity factor
MTFLDFFRRRPRPAAIAKERLSIIVARERDATRGRGPDYLPQLQQELLAVLAKFEKIDLSNVSVKVDRAGNYDVLELNIILPDEAPDTTTSAAAKKAPTLQA